MGHQLYSVHVLISWRIASERNGRRNCDPPPEAYLCFSQKLDPQLYKESKVTLNVGLDP